MKILVIGASGFLGERVFKELVNRGHAVYGPSRSGNLFGQLDITDPESCRRTLDQGHFDSVVNLAGRGVTAGSASEIEMRRVNHEGAIILGNAIVGTREPPWLVQASSSTEPRGPEVPESSYTFSKAAGTLDMCKIMGGAQIPFAVARIHNVYGPEQPRGRFVMRVMTRLFAGERVYVAYPVRVRDFCYVSEVVQHLANLTESGHSTRIVSEIGTGRGTTLWDLVNIVRRRIGAPANLIVPHGSGGVDPNEYQVANSRSPNFLRCETTLEDGVALTLRSLT